MTELEACEAYNKAIHGYGDYINTLPSPARWKMTDFAEMNRRTQDIWKALQKIKEIRNDNIKNRVS